MLKKSFRKNRIGLLALLSAVLMLCLTGCGSTKTVKLADFAHCKLQGYDGFGTLTDSFDTDGLVRAVADAAGYSEKKSDYEDKLDLIREDLEDLLEGKWSKTDHITVGDELTYRWDVEAEALKKKYNVIFDAADYTHTAAEKELDALKELTADDLFKVTFDGYSGAGSVFVSNNSKELKEIAFSLPEMPNGAASPDAALSNGDVIEITLSLRTGEDMKEYLGTRGFKVPENNILKVTVEGLQEPKEVDPFTYLLLSLHGVNGYAQLDWEFTDSTPDPVRYLNVAFNKQEDLSNGDEVIVTLSDGDADPTQSCLRSGIRLTSTEKVFPIADLEEPRDLNPFDYLSVTYDGVSGNGTAVLELITDNEFSEVLNGISISPAKSIALTQGDKLTFTVLIPGSDDVVDACLRRYGVRLTQTEKQYSVDEIDRYITSVKELPENMASAMQAKAETIDWQNNWEEVTIDKIECLGNRFYYRLKYSTGNNNCLFFLYRITATHAEYGEFIFYNYTCYFDILLQKDGTIELDYDDYSTSTQWCDPTGHAGWFGNVEGYETMEALLDNAFPFWPDNFELEENLIAD